jgi:hypothetical protein
MAFTNVYDVTFPPDTQLANLLGSDLRNLALNVQQRMAAISGIQANQPNLAGDAQPTNWTGLLYFATDTSRIFQWSGSAWVDITSSIGFGRFKFEGSNLVPVIVSDTVTLSPLQSITIPANDIGIGQTFYLEASGQIGIQSTGDTISISIYLDSVLLSIATFGLAAANSQSWFLRGFFSGLTTGVTGTVTGCSFIWNSTPSGGGFQTPNTAGDTPQSVVVDTTSSHSLTIMVQWGQAKVNDTITENFMNCYRIG